MNDFYKYCQELYASIKPVNGARTPPSLDVRPLASRKKKHERIIKIQEPYETNPTYVLDDGHYTWSGVHIDAGNATPTDNDYLTFAPIVVREHPIFGCIVRLCIGRLRRQAGRRYYFMRDWLPRGLSIERTGSKYFVNNGLDRYYIPKSGGDMDWERAYYAHYSRYQSQQNRVETEAEQENTYLEFVYNSGQWELFHDSPRYDNVKGTVNKELKKQYAQEVRAFTDWCLMLSDILKPQDLQFGEESNITLRAAGAVEDTGMSVCASKVANLVFSEGLRPLLLDDVVMRPDHYTWFSYRHAIRNNSPKTPMSEMAYKEKEALIYRDIINNEEHPQRTAFATLVLSASGYFYKSWQAQGWIERRNRWDPVHKKMVPMSITHDPLTAEEWAKEVSKIRSRMTQKLNKLCGFIHTV